MKNINIEELREYPFLCVDPVTGIDNVSGEKVCRPLGDDFNGTIIDVMTGTGHETSYHLTAYKDWLSDSEKADVVKLLYSVFDIEKDRRDLSELESFRIGNDNAYGRILKNVSRYVSDDEINAAICSVFDEEFTPSKRS
jgi:hypothetical protein